ncbi:MAG: hypothetical protein HRU38_16985 [Saccharospirillaceae bacterium]|nr:hypothetical protein [Pseudomonadales bacterium]NRB80333.1 hypothetical protein [Saccharospirillaceae bacterium]
MSIQYSLIEDAFDYASFGFYGQSEAYINIDNDEIILYRESDPENGHLPEDIEDDKFVKIPHKRDLNLGSSLPKRFARMYPAIEPEIAAIFKKAGAYQNFRQLLAREDLVIAWREFDKSEQSKALLNWCELNQIDFVESVIDEDEEDQDSGFFEED